jgi:prolipoprotein diacylglyceryltransferase
VAAHLAVGQQVAATLQQLAQYSSSRVMAGHQFAQVLNQLAHQCASAAQAGRIGGFGTQAIYGQPFGSGQAYGQAWGVNRPQW